MRAITQAGISQGATLRRSHALLICGALWELLFGAASGFSACMKERARDRALGGLDTVVNKTGMCYVLRPSSRFPSSKQTNVHFFDRFLTGISQIPPIPVMRIVVIWGNPSAAAGWKQFTCAPARLETAA